ncbi:MAG: hypothetical protein ACKVW3_00065 [Phycisphaerales bacterium]
MRLSDAEARQRTLDELPAIKRRLAQGKPEVLGLVLTSADDTREPWHNHQVLAYGHGERDGQSGATVIRIYDPNYPDRDDAVLVLGKCGESLAGRRVVPGRRTTPVRGVFRMSYSPVTPPETLAR